ncbi:O-antigen ligase family protein [Bdellovibrio bacteriovorus]|uniref:O-antigen ligase family protein n=1 Tax=Bdellovibrio bacteriovorus TaxID=959 RepID=UPI0035A5FFB2
MQASKVWSERLLIGALYAFSLSVFVSVSLVAAFQILLVIAFLLAAFSGGLSLKLPKSGWFLLAFVFAQILSGILNFPELQEKSHALGLIKYPLVGLIGVILFRNLQSTTVLKDSIRPIFYLFLLSIVVACIHGVIKVYLGYDVFKLRSGDFGTRVGGFTDVMRYGYGSAIVLLILTGLSFNLKRFPSLNRNFIYFAILFGGVGLVLSYTRGALLGLLMGVPIIVFYYRRIFGYWIAGLSAAVIGALVVVALLGGSQASRFFMSATSSSNTIRLSQYQSAWKAFLENPVVGLGPQQLKYHVQDLKERYDLPHKEYVNEHSHNVFLETLANTGILGFIAFMLWITSWAIEIFKSSNLHKQIFLPVVVFIFVAGQFEMLFMAQTSTLIYFLYSLSFVEIDPDRQKV